VLGQTFVGMLEDTYVSFRRTIDLMVRNTTCPCNACRNIGALDLKFFVHYGEFGIQKLDAHDELVGSDVNLLHRLLKNHVTERTGLNAYTLYSEPAITHLGLQESLPNLIENEEMYEHLGTVRTWVQDMHPVWERRKKDVQVRVTPDRELFRAATEIPLSAEVVWDYLIQPEHYNVLVGATKIEITDRKGGRVTEGSAFQCYHGGQVLPLTVLEWQPFELITTEFKFPAPMTGASGLCELRLLPTEGGTRLEQAYSKIAGPLIARTMGTMFIGKMRKKAAEDVARFGEHVVKLEREKGLKPAAPPSSLMVDAAAMDALRESLKEAVPAS
jgi:hypothetical protein